MMTELTWPEAVDAVCTELERFVTCRASGFEVPQAAAAIGVTPATGIRYERVITGLLRDLKNETVPGPARPETAPPTKAQINP
jgi:hypothetical protein